MAALIDIDQLRTFIAIVETGSFTRAADIVHKTQSAVSMQMKRLEERVGRPVFARDGRASKLTEDGDRLLDYARRIVKLNIEALAAFTETELAGRVRLGVGVRTFSEQFNTNWTLFCAAAVMGSVPILIVFFLAQRFLVEGLTRGAVKG